MEPFIEAAAAAPARLAPLLESARTEGRSTLLEHEALELVAGLGLKVPTYQVLSDPESAHGLELEAFPGDRVVVKALAPDLIHKTEAGAVAVTPARPEAVARAAWQIEEALGHPDLRGFLVEAFVEHDMEPGGELLLGMRHSREFGPVVTLGLGGVAAELLARELPPGRGVRSFSPELARNPAGILEILEGTLLLKLATGRIRGRAGRAASEVVAEAVARFLEAAPELLPDPFVEIEVNPLVFTPGGAVALDAVARLAPEAPASPAPPRPREQLRRLLRPRSVAVVGASRSMNPGRVILRNVLAAGFEPQDMTVVKPGLDELDGCRCVPDLASLPEPVDVLVLAVSAARVPELMDEVLEGRRAESVILIPGGMGEGESDREPVRRLQDALAEARRAGRWTPVVNGGNCLGVRSVPGGYDTLFIPRYKLPFPATGRPPDPVAIISQSGAWAIARASHLPELDPRYVVTFGNQLDLTVSDHLRAVAEDDRVRVAACYVEGFRPDDGRELLEAAKELTEEGRCVILYRAGRSPEGSKAAAGHTASVAGDYALTIDLARQAGVLVAGTAREFHQLTDLALRLDRRQIEGTALGAVSNAGFECVAMADHAGELSLAELSPETEARLAGVLEEAGLTGIVAPRNPLDVTPILDDEGFERAARALLEDPAVDVGAVGCVPLTPALKTLPVGPTIPEDVSAEDSVGSRLVRLWKETEKGWVAVVDGGPPYDPLARMLSQGGIPVFRSADEGLKLLARYAAWRVRSGSR